MRRIVSLAAAAALLSSLVVAGTTSAAPRTYSTTVTVQCDTATNPLQVGGRFYANYDQRRPKALDLNGSSGYTWWTFSCPQDEAAVLTQTFTTRAVPTHATVELRRTTECGAAIVFPVPSRVTGDQVTDCLAGYTLSWVEISTPVRN